ncbi:MAG: hypothetical protein U0807_15395 [Candidatus Binatia bacterium]
MKWTSWVSLIALVLIGAVVVATSLHVGGERCEVCIAFDGREACRTVDADTEDEARRGAVTNTCAQLTAGVTQTLACERTPPTRVDCQAR